MTSVLPPPDPKPLFSDVNELLLMRTYCVCEDCVAGFDVEVAAAALAAAASWFVQARFCGSVR
jgi:hypothetical protein